MEEADRTACSTEEANEYIVFVAEKPPLEPGGLLESIDTVLEEVADSAGGLTRLYGTVLTRVVGDLRPISCIPGVIDCPLCCVRSAMKRETRKSDWNRKDTVKMMAVPARNPVVSAPRVFPLDKQMSVATVKAAVTTQSPVPHPKTSGVTLLAGFLCIAMMTTQHSNTKVADSDIVAIIAAVLVGDVGFV